MNSRTALAALTATALCLGGAATAQAASSSDAPAAAAASTTAASATAASATTTPAASPAPSAVPAHGDDDLAPVTVVVTVTASPTTPPPTGPGAKLVEMSSVDEETQRFFAILQAVMVGVGVSIEVLYAVLASSPAMQEQLKNFLAQLPPLPQLPF